jgi:GTP 3',8-cyclase
MKSLRRSGREIFYRFVPEKIRPYIEDRVRYFYTLAQRQILHGGEDLPINVTIETNSLCTRSCYYCPRDGNPNDVLDEETYYPLIDQLADWGFRGMFSPIGYNEPLTDERIFEFLKHARGKLPDSEIVLLTNGDLLNPDSIEKLADSGVSEIKISIHEPSTPQFTNTIMAYQEMHPNLITVMDMRDGSRTATLFNRGGLIDLGDVKHLPRCYKIDVLTVRADGSVALCCDDYDKEHVFGNVKTEDIKSIWEGEYFSSVRDEVRKGRYSLDICKACGHEKSV